jgi:peptidoglycan/LPS O-acetylase OafA/YrhL/lysophospholipase L1-like esterase
LAVLFVLFFHGGFSWFGGGFFGVDIFFVLSGFLITGLLLSEFQQTDAIRLGRFWAHRARRLMPALLLVLVVIAGYCALFASPSELHQLRVDSLCSLFYVNNWNLAHESQGYFAALQAAAPRPLIHTWSLSIEEQFYLVWPLIVLAVLRWTRSLKLLLGIAIAGVLSSAAAMAVLFNTGGGQARVYYGTDTRAQAVLTGAVLAILLGHRLDRKPRMDTERVVILSMSRQIEPGPWAARLASATGAISLLTLVLIGWAVDDATPWLYRGGFLLVSVSSAILIASVVLQPDSHWGGFLELRPVRYVGAISYGLYLWHWPLFILLDHSRTGLSGIPLFALRMTATFAVAALSFKLLEMPIRRGLLRGLWALGALLSSIALVTGLLVLTTSGAGPSAPASDRASKIIDAVDNTAVSSDPGTSPNVPAVPAGTLGPARVLVLGDSEAAFLSMGMGPLSSSQGVSFAQDSTFGCGFVNGPSKLDGKVYLGRVGIRSKDLLVPCATQLTRWSADVNRFNPDVVVIVNGAFDVHDHLYDGRWTSLDDPKFRAAERAAMLAAVRAVKRPANAVVLTTAPYYHQPERLDGSAWPEDAHRRVDTYDQLLRSVAASLRPGVRVVDVHSYLDPKGGTLSAVGGAPTYLADGIHLSLPGATYLSKWLLPRLAAISDQVRAAAAAR